MRTIVFLMVLLLMSCEQKREVKNCILKQDYVPNFNASNIINKVINCNFKKHEIVYIVYISYGSYKGLIFSSTQDKKFSFRLDLFEGEIKQFGGSELDIIKDFNIVKFKRMLKEKSIIKDLDFSHPTHVGLLVFESRKFKYEFARSIYTLNREKLKKIGFTNLPFRDEINKLGTCFRWCFVTPSSNLKLRINQKEN